MGDIPRSKRLTGSLAHSFADDVFLLKTIITVCKDFIDYFARFIDPTIAFTIIVKRIFIGYLFL